MVLIPCLVGPAQQAVSTLPTTTDVADYKQMRDCILHTLNLSPEASRKQLREIVWSDYHHPLLTNKKIWVRWLRPVGRTAEQTVKAVMVQHYKSILPFKPKNWALCHQPATLEDTITLMEAYASMEASHYLMPKVWKQKGDMGEHGYQGMYERPRH